MNPKQKAIAFLSNEPEECWKTSISEAIDVALEEQAKQIFKEVESNIIWPYRGTMTNGTKEEEELHTKMMDNLGQWFNKLKNKWCEK